MVFQGRPGSSFRTSALGTLSRASRVRTEDKRIRAWAVEASVSHFACRARARGGRAGSTGLRGDPEAGCQRSISEQCLR